MRAASWSRNRKKASGNFANNVSLRDMGRTGSAMQFSCYRLGLIFFNIIYMVGRSGPRNITSFAYMSLQDLNISTFYVIWRLQSIKHKISVTFPILWFMPVEYVVLKFQCMFEIEKNSRDDPQKVKMVISECVYQCNPERGRHGAFDFQKNSRSKFPPYSQKSRENQIRSPL